MKIRIFPTLLLFFLLTTAFAQTPLKVACIGNSITEGYGVPAGRKYPDVLQALLGATHTVRNYGISGRTLLKKGDHPYWNEQKYREALRWQPDIVVIKLGTNDAKPQNWQYKKEFKKDYLALIRSFQKLPGQPRIYICQPMPAYYTNFSINPQVIREEMRPLINRIARKARVRVIDLYTPMLDKNALVPDGIHPNAEGAALLAREVYRAIRL